MLEWTPPLSLGHNDGTNADIEDSTTLIRLLSQVTSQTLSIPARTYCALRYSKLLQGFLLVIVSVSIGLHEAPHFHHHHSTSSDLDPSDLIEECICKLTGMLNPSAHQAYSDVEDWFLTGPGKSISPPDLEDCNWKTDFAKLFALLILRAALNITTTSWYNEHTVIESTADICRHHWHRIGCNDNNEIVALHLSNGDFAGTIPSELGAITTLKHIELYKNFDIVGTIPSEVGNLVNLEILHLHQTSLSGSLQASIGKLTKLQELFVDDTKLEGKCLVRYAAFALQPNIKRATGASLLPCTRTVVVLTQRSFVIRPVVIFVMITIAIIRWVVSSRSSRLPHQAGHHL